MKYFDPDNGAWQEILPGEQRAQTQDFDSISMASSTAGDNHRGLYRTKSSSSRHSLRSNGTDGGTGSTIIRVTRGISSRRKRVILKNGTVNLSKLHVSKRSQRYLQDIFTTLVDIQWRYNLMVFALGFLLSWLGFALIWWLICLAHGDFEHFGEENWTPCVADVHNFATAFLFSVETQHTIGYGSRCTTDECPEAMFIMCAQSITGVMIQCFMAGIVFAKLSRPKNRSQTLMFSRYACVCLRDGKLCFMFRVGDMRKSHIIGATISAQVIRRKTTIEGEVWTGGDFLGMSTSTIAMSRHAPQRRKEYTMTRTTNEGLMDEQGVITRAQLPRTPEVIPYYHTLLDVRFDDRGGEVLLIWPATIVHEINETSPFYLQSAEDMLRERFEVVVILEGTIESTGQSIQARSSYIASEILWGHRFDQVVSFRKETGEYLVDYSKFNATNEVQTPLCSARDYYEYKKMIAQATKSPAFTNPPDNSASSTQGSNSTPEGTPNESKKVESPIETTTPETPLLTSTMSSTSEC